LRGLRTVHDEVLKICEETSRADFGTEKKRPKRKERGEISLNDEYSKAEGKGFGTQESP